jgi:peroxiredoxin
MLPRQPAPSLVVDLVGGSVFALAKEMPANFTLIAFYRGLHCPICKTQVRELDSQLDEFDSRGVGVAAVSCDSEERATRSKEVWAVTRLRLGYGLSLASARQWGVFISTGRGMTSAGVEEPARFSEPALRTFRSISESFCIG